MILRRARWLSPILLAAASCGDHPSLVASDTPVAINGLPGVESVTAACDHVCARTTDGDAFCWGNNVFGQLGTGEQNNHSSRPVKVRGVTAIRSLAGGLGQTCGVLADQTAVCWGDNSDGLLGNASSGHHSTTAVPVTGLANVTSMAAGDHHGCAALADGTAHCWGNNAIHQLGSSDAASSSIAIPIAGLTGVVEVTAGYNFSCAMLTDGTARCWGGNQFGEIGSGSAQRSAASPEAVAGLNGAAAVDAGWAHACAVLTDGTARCWGGNPSGQLGRGDLVDARTPVAVAQLSGVVSISAGKTHTCAVMEDGTARCWGKNDAGQLGNGTRTDSAVPVAVKDLANVTSISAGCFHTCASLGSGAVKCWGGNDDGVLGVEPA
jgi:alpha-tubulin suppressor-like RCC1 family protein